MRCLKPGFQEHLPWTKMQTDEKGSMTELLFPSLAIASLAFHPRNWPNLHKRAQAVFEAPGATERVYGHPFSADEALRAQAIVDALPPEYDGLGRLVVQLLVGLNLGKDKTDVERMKSLDALHLKLLNTGLGEWFMRQSKILLSLAPGFIRDDDVSQAANARAKQVQYQRSLALVLVCLEVCAKKGILCTHR